MVRLVPSGALLAVFLASNALTGAQILQGTEEQCMAALGGLNVTVLMVAVAYGRHPEAAFYLGTLENELSVPQSETICAYKRTGTILGQPVMIAATNEGYFAASLCTYEILACAPYIKEVIWSGTAGGSPQKGGILNPADCSTPVDNGDEGVLRIGDVCISPFAVEYSCTAASWSMQCAMYPSICTAPQVEPGYGTPIESGNPQCVWDVKQSVDLGLADEIIAASSSYEALALYPSRPADITALETAYWANMSAGTGVQYKYDAAAPPKIWDYSQCMEASSLSYWTGTPYDYTMRQYVALAINEALGLNLTALDVVGATAEEASGFAAAIYKHQGIPGTSPVPFVVIRGISDYSSPPVYTTGNGVWGEMADSELSTSTSSAQSVASFSSAVMNLFIKRCKEQGLAGCQMAQLSNALPPSVLKSYASA